MLVRKGESSRSAFREALCSLAYTLTACVFLTLLGYLALSMKRIENGDPETKSAALVISFTSKEGATGDTADFSLGSVTHETGQVKEGDVRF